MFNIGTFTVQKADLSYFLTRPKEISMIYYVILPMEITNLFVIVRNR